MTIVKNNIQNLQVNAGDEIRSFPKSTCRIQLIKNRLTLRDVADAAGGVVTLSSNQVTDPSEQNNRALALKLIGYLDTGVGANLAGEIQTLDDDIVNAFDNMSVSQPNANTSNIPDAIQLNETTSVKIADTNSAQKYFHVCNNDTQKAVWVKLQAAGVDNDKKGILLESKGNTGSHFALDASIYRGEISAIAQSGSPVVNVTTF